MSDTLRREYGSHTPEAEHVRALTERAVDIYRRKRDAEIEPILPELTALFTQMAAAGGTYRLTDDEYITFITWPPDEPTQPDELIQMLTQFLERAGLPGPVRGANPSALG